MPLNWTELRDFAFSEDGYSVANANRNNKSTANGSSGNARSGDATSAAVAGVGVGVAGGAGGGAGAAEDRPKRWDQPFHHTVPSFPMPRKRPAPWGDVAPGGGGEGEGKEGREEGFRGGERGGMPCWVWG